VGSDFIFAPDVSETLGKRLGLALFPTGQGESGVSDEEEDAEAGKDSPKPSVAGPTSSAAVPLGWPKVCGMLV
jgi:hypothetical protein